MSPPETALSDSERCLTGVVRPIRWEGKASGTCQRIFSAALATPLSRLAPSRVVAPMAQAIRESLFLVDMQISFLLLFCARGRTRNRPWDEGVNRPEQEQRPSRCCRSGASLVLWFVLASRGGLQVLCLSPANEERRALQRYWSDCRAIAVSAAADTARVDMRQCPKFWNMSNSVDGAITNWRTNESGVRRAQRRMRGRREGRRISWRLAWPVCFPVRCGSAPRRCPAPAASAGCRAAAALAADAARRSSAA